MSPERSDNKFFLLQSTDLGFLEGRHDLSGLVLQRLQLLHQLAHQLLVVLQLRLHAAHALLALLQVAAATGRRLASPLDPLTPTPTTPPAMQRADPRLLPLGRLDGHLGLGDGGRAVVQRCVDLVQLVLLGLQLVAVDVHDQVVQPLHLVLHLPGFAGRGLVIWRERREGRGGRSRSMSSRI